MDYFSLFIGQHHSCSKTTLACSSYVMDSFAKSEEVVESCIFPTAHVADARTRTKGTKRRRRSSPAAFPMTEFQIDQAVPLATASASTTTTTKRSSRFRGVSRHRWTGRYEAHLWDKGTWNPTQKKKGKQVYLGAYDEEEAAARAYDLAAIKYWGTSTYTNFPILDYEKEIEIMQNVSKEEYLASLRRRSSGFARGVSKYRGVARHHHNGRWEARIGRVFGNKYLYLGTYGTQEEAAQAYDIAAIEYRGINAVTNFDLSTYIRWLRPGDLQNPEAAIKQPDSAYMMMNLNKEPDFLNSNCFPIKNQAITQKHEIIERKMPLGPSNHATSPTALGLLLRSSMFKEMVEKTTMTTTTTSTATSEENDVKPCEDDLLSFYPGNDHFCEVAHVVKDEKGDTSKKDSFAMHDQMVKGFWNVVEYGE